MSRNRTTTKSDDPHSLSLVEVLCLVIVLLVAVFIGKGVLKHRNTRVTEVASAHSDTRTAVGRQAVESARHENLVYRPSGPSETYDRMDEAWFDDEDDPFADEDPWAEEAETTPTKPAQLIQFRPVAAGEEDPLVQYIYCC